MEVSFNFAISHRTTEYNNSQSSKVPRDNKSENNMEEQRSKNNGDSIPYSLNLSL
jgi:hypothetical protein